jgi:hypothetical protein
MLVVVVVMIVFVHTKRSKHPVRRGTTTTTRYHCWLFFVSICFPITAAIVTFEPRDFSRAPVHLKGIHFVYLPKISNAFRIAAFSKEVQEVHFSLTANTVCL